MSLHSTRQPDDPGPASGICPCCNRPFPDEDADALRLLKANAGKVAAHRIALALRWPLHRLERFAAAQKPPIDLRWPPRGRDDDAEPRGA